MSIPGPPHRDPPRCPGQTSVSARERQQALVEAVEDLASALLALDGEVRPRDVADEEAVARQERPGLVAARAVDEREGRVLGAVAGGVDGAHDERAELELVAVVEGLVLVLRLRDPVDVNGRARGGREPAVTRDVVGVVVGLEHVVDLDAEVARELEVLVDLEARVDHRGDARRVVTDEVRRASEVVVSDLPEDHVRIFSVNEPSWIWVHPKSRSGVAGRNRNVAWQGRE